MPRKITKTIAILLSFLFLLQQTGFAQVAGQIDIAGHLAKFHQSLTTDKFRPLHLRYLEYIPQDNSFKLLIDKGNQSSVILSPKGEESNIVNKQLESTSKTLFKYFLIGLTLPNESFWVNLRPDSPDNIIDDSLAKTDIGRIMLEADLELKKDTASATSPDTKEGRIYWDKLYKKAGELFGSENITIPTLTRPWIVPDEVIVRESQDSAYIYKATLKVMLEEDYLKVDSRNQQFANTYSFQDERLKALNQYSTQLIKELIIPKLTLSINTSKKYAELRQVYYSLILAQWFKAQYRGQRPSLQGAVPITKLIDSQDLTNLTSKISYSKDTYFNQYKDSFAKGEYNFQEPVYTMQGKVVRSYFSGGMAWQDLVGSHATKLPTAVGNSPAVNAKNMSWARVAFLAGLISAQALSLDPNTLGGQEVTPNRESTTTTEIITVDQVKPGITDKGKQIAQLQPRGSSSSALGLGEILTEYGFLSYLRDTVFISGFLFGAPAITLGSLFLIKFLICDAGEIIKEMIAASAIYPVKIATKEGDEYVLDLLGDSRLGGNVLVYVLRKYITDYVVDFRYPGEEWESSSLLYFFRNHIIANAYQFARGDKKRVIIVWRRNREGDIELEVCNSGEASRYELNRANGVIQEEIRGERGTRMFRSYAGPVKYFNRDGWTVARVILDDIKPLPLMRLWRNILRVFALVAKKPQQSTSQSMSIINDGSGDSKPVARPESFTSNDSGTTFGASSPMDSSFLISNIEEIRQLEVILKTPGLNPAAYRDATIALNRVLRGKPELAAQIVQTIETVLETPGLNPAAYGGAASVLNIIAKNKPELIQSTTVAALETVFKSPGLDSDGYLQVIYALESIAKSKPELAVQAVQALESILKIPGLDSYTYIYTTSALNRIFKNKPELIQSTTVAALETVLETPGLNPAAYGDAASVLNIIAKEKPELIQSTTVAALETVLKVPGLDSDGYLQVIYALESIAKNKPELTAQVAQVLASGRSQAKEKLAKVRKDASDLGLINLGVISQIAIKDGHIFKGYDADYDVVFVEDEVMSILVKSVLESTGAFNLGGTVVVPETLLKKAREGDKEALMIIKHEHRHVDYHNLHGDPIKYTIEQHLVDELYAYFSSFIDVYAPEKLREDRVVERGKMRYWEAVAGTLDKEYINLLYRNETDANTKEILRVKSSIAAKVIHGLILTFGPGIALGYLKEATDLDTLLSTFKLESLRRDIDYYRFKGGPEIKVPDYEKLKAKFVRFKATTSQQVSVRASSPAASSPMQAGEEVAVVKAIEQAIQEDRQGLEQFKQEKIKSGLDKEKQAALSQVPADALEVCEIAQQDLAIRLKAYLQGKAKIITHSSMMLFGLRMGGKDHKFVVVAIPQGKNYLLDTSLHQYFYEGYEFMRNVRERIDSNPRWKNISTSILQDGFIELSPDVLEMYKFILSGLRSTTVNDVLRIDTDFLSEDDTLESFMPPLQPVASSPMQEDEASAFQGIEQVRGFLGNLLRDRPNEPIIIAVDGVSGAGKSRFLRGVREGRIDLGILRQDMIFIHKDLFIEYYDSAVSGSGKINDYLSAEYLKPYALIRNDMAKIRVTPRLRVPKIYLAHYLNNSLNELFRGKEKKIILYEGVGAVSDFEDSIENGYKGEPLNLIKIKLAKNGINQHYLTAELGRIDPVSSSSLQAVSSSLERAKEYTDKFIQRFGAPSASFGGVKELRNPRARAETMHPIIYINSLWQDEMTEDERERVLAHEVQHTRTTFLTYQVGLKLEGLLKTKEFQELQVRIGNLYDKVLKEKGNIFGKPKNQYQEPWEVLSLLRGYEIYTEQIRRGLQVTTQAYEFIEAFIEQDLNFLDEDYLFKATKDFNPEKKDLGKTIVITAEDLLKADDIIRSRKTASSAVEVLDNRDSDSFYSSTKDVVKRVAVPEQNTPGGIDFRAIPIVTQAIGNLSGGIRLNKDLAARLSSLNLDAELGQMQKMVDSGISPSSQRVKEYVQSSCLQGKAVGDMDKVILCIADILRLEEERCCSTDPTLRDILVVLESQKSSQQLHKIFLGNA